MYTFQQGVIFSVYFIIFCSALKLLLDGEESKSTQTALKLLKIQTSEDFPLKEFAHG